MSSLLPQLEKKALVIEYRLRLLIVVLCFISVVAIIFSILLVPKWVMLSTRLKEVDGQYETAQSVVKSKTDPKIIASLVDAKNRLTAIKSLDSAGVVDDIFTRILFYKGKDILITNFTVSQENNGVRQVSIVGVALSRQALLDFSKRLQKEKSFVNIVLPISSFEKNRDINFTLQFGVTMKSDEK